MANEDKLLQVAANFLDLEEESKDKISWYMLGRIEEREKQKTKEQTQVHKTN